jgi:hypothetical protein
VLLCAFLRFFGLGVFAPKMGERHIQRFVTETESQLQGLLASLADFREIASSAVVSVIRFPGSPPCGLSAPRWL